MEYALAKGWRLEPGSGHVWGTLKCPLAERAGCKVIVFSIPQNPGNHARRIKSDIDRCPHR